MGPRGFTLSTGGVGWQGIVGVLYVEDGGGALRVLSRGPTGRRWRGDGGVRGWLRVELKEVEGGEGAYRSEGAALGMLRWVQQRSIRQTSKQSYGLASNF